MGAKQLKIIPRPPAPPVSDEQKLEIKQAAKVIKQSGRGRLPEEIVFDILLWTAEGVNWQKIQKRVLKKHERMLPKATIEKYQKEHASRIRELTSEWDKEAITAGLARKAVRLRKLQKIADSIEERILGGDDDDENDVIKALAANPANLKALVSEYRELLKQIGVEVGDIDEGTAGDIAFIGMSNDQLMAQAAKILAKNKDLAIIAAEKAGVRPSVPESIQGTTDGEDHSEEHNEEDAEEDD